MIRPMRRSHHRPPLTEAIAEATARFQADLRRLARTVLRDELARILTTNEPMLTPTVTGTRALHVAPVAGPRRSPAAGLRKPASPAAARRTTAARTSKPTAAARTSKPAAAAARTSKPAGTSKPASAARTSRPAAAAGTHVEPAVAPAKRLAAAPVPAVAGTPEDPAVVIAKLELATTAGLDIELAPLAESAPAATNEELPRRGRARAPREERLQRRKEQEENARSRRAAAAAGTRPESVAVAGACPEPTAAVRAEPMTAVVHEDEARAMGGRVQRGTVKWFSEVRGYGFIKGDDGADAFVHHSSISGEGFRTLSEGQTVSYEEVEGPKGLVAMNVVPDGDGDGSASTVVKGRLGLEQRS